MLPTGGRLHFGPPLRAGGETVQVWLTTPDLVSGLSQQPSLTFAPARDRDAPTIQVDDTITYQQMDGFGAAVTDTSAWLIAKKLSPPARTHLMTALFSPTQGIGIDWIRVPMGSSDFTHDHYYSYDDNGGTPDPSLADFSISHDLSYIIPLLQQAMRLNPAIKLDANPWSPPAWMKSNHSMTGGGTLLSRYYGALAYYFVKFLQAYRTQGLPIFAVQPQNEPLAQAAYPSMNMSAPDEARFIADNLGPALAAADLHPKILGFDHNWAQPGYPETLLGDPSAAAYLAGTAWHSYAGTPNAMSVVHGLYPTKEVYETESSVAHPVDLFINAARNWSKTGVMWNIALDNYGGPLPNNPACRGCVGLVTIDQSTGTYRFTNYYYEIGQFSKFVLPGATRIYSTSFGGADIEDVAFKNPDRSEVVVAYNASKQVRRFSVRLGSEAVDYSLPAGGIATFTWRNGGAPTGTGGARPGVDPAASLAAANQPLVGTRP
jgi:glucosylceramidase